MNRLPWSSGVYSERMFPPTSSYTCSPTCAQSSLEGQRIITSGFRFAIGGCCDHSCTGDPSSAMDTAGEKAYDIMRASAARFACGGRVDVVAVVMVVEVGCMQMR